MDQLKTRLRDAKLGSAIENAAGKLPYEYTIEVTIEHGSGYVSLWGPEGACEFPSNNESIADGINDAVEFAIADASRVAS